jgi:hypothetical protein
VKFRKYLIPLLLIMILSLVLAGCGGSEPPQDEVEEPPVEETESPAAPSEDPQPVKTQVTSIDQIVGTWIAPAYPGNFVLTVFPDGKLSVATSLEDLEAGSTDSWNLVIEDGQITASGFALCLGDVGTYIAEIDKDGNLRFISIIDACDARLRKMDRSLPGRLNDYILIFRPVN